MNKTAIKNFAVWARKKLISEITYKAGLLGITEKGIVNPLPQSTSDLQFFDIGTKDYATVSGEEINERNALVSIIKSKEHNSDYKTAFQTVIEEVAYTWFNRLIAIRFMEANDYLPSRIRVLSSENKEKLEPDFVTTPFETDLEFSPYERDRVMQLKDENKLDELFRMLFIMQCNQLNSILPELFEETNNYSELLLNISFTDKDGVVYHLTHDIDEADFKEQVQIIGWLYQYYNSEPKDEVFALLKNNVKITKEHIPAATQLFTPDWIVRYMVENSLGRMYIDKRKNEGIYADGRGWDETEWREAEAHRIANESHIASEMRWKYFLPEAEQPPEVREQLDKIREEYKTMNPEEIKVIDPCMGSGHILVYIFDVLMQIYESYGYNSRDAAARIVENNLYGLDIDDRAAQFAYFAVMMKARQYDRRFFTRDIKPHIHAIPDYQDWKEYGSLVKIDKIPERAKNDNSQIAFGEINDDIINQVVDVAEILTQKYDVVITNPPYMGSSGMNTKLSDFVKKYYPDSKSDLFSVFMERGCQLTKLNGYNCMVTMQSWMFLSSFEKMREKLLNTKTITNLMHMENMVMGIAFGTTVANIRWFCQIMWSRLIPQKNIKKR